MERGNCGRRQVGAGGRGGGVGAPALIPHKKDRQLSVSTRGLWL